MVIDAVIVAVVYIVVVTSIGIAIAAIYVFLPITWLLLVFVVLLVTYVVITNGVFVAVTVVVMYRSFGNGSTIESSVHIAISVADDATYAFVPNCCCYCF